MCLYSKRIFKNIISFFMCICLILSISVNCVYAKDALKNTKGNITIVENNDEIIHVIDEYKGDELHAIFNKRTMKITMEVLEKSKMIKRLLRNEKSEITNYEVRVKELRNPKKQGVSAIIVDKNTKKEYKIGECDKVKAQAPAVVPLIEILGVEILEVLGEIGLVTVMSGATYIAASEINHTMTQAFANSRPASPYFQAYIDYNLGDVMIGPKIEIGTAITRILAGLDVMCMSGSDAEDLIKACDPSFKPVGPEKHKGRGKYYYHYHRNGREDGHAFYLY